MIGRKEAAQLCAVLLVFIILMMALSAAARAESYSPYVVSHLPTAEPAFCADTQAEWNADPEGGSGVLAYTYIRGPRLHEIHISPEVCSGLLHPGKNRAFASAAQTVYHEWVHAYFLEDDGKEEGNAECISLFFYRYALQHFWGLSASVAQADYNMAWSEHVDLGLLYPAYKGTCSK